MKKYIKWLAAYSASLTVAVNAVPFAQLSANAAYGFSFTCFSHRDLICFIYNKKLFISLKHQSIIIYKLASYRENL